MRIIHIVSSITKINFGIWNAAIFSSEYLNERYQVKSELWICTKSEQENITPQIPYYFFDKKKKTKSGFRDWIKHFDAAETIIVTHGAWLLPTKLGFWAKKEGYKWIYTPHGMLEPWGFKKGKFKKRLYFYLFEQRMNNDADAIRAVSQIEKKNLEYRLKRKIELIFNGVLIADNSELMKSKDETNYLFLARLHSKKGLIFLVKAWAESMYECNNTNLLIAGPDEGELELIKPYLKNNITYLGPIYGKEKERLLKEAHYYILPSFSEGFPTSIVEGMSHGAIPIISEGCNFPEVFSENIGYKVYPDKESIKKVFSELRGKAFDPNLSNRNIEYVNKNLSDRKIGTDLYQLYSKLLNI